MYNFDWVGRLAVCSGLWLLACSSSDSSVQRGSETVARIDNGLPTTPAAIVAGTIAGTFKADPSGNASYTVKIEVPPGTAGMQPGLNLTYSSSGGGGLLGQGWSLGGLSAISRCAGTQAQDGALGRIQYDASDKFCIDGMRLVQTSSGAGYWEYRTEIEGFSRIRAYGTSASNPQYWEVKTRTGQTMLYGSTEDSRIERQRGACENQFVYSTPGTFSLAIPAGMDSATISVVGAGGGGGGGSFDGDCQAGGGGGSGGYVAPQTKTVNAAGETLSITIGAGGAGDAANNGGTGGSGGTSSVTGSFGTLTATGGAGGRGAYAGSYNGSGGLGGSPSGASGVTPPNYGTASYAGGQNVSGTGGGGAGNGCAVAGAAGQPGYAKITYCPSVVRIWSLAKVSDVKSNYLTVSYAEDNALGEYVPTRIDYTANDAVGLTAKQAVVFVYEARPDARAGFFSGDLVSNTKRLSAIQTYVDATTLAREVRVAYTTGLLGRSLVSSLQECGWDNHCYAATEFSYQGGTDGLRPPESWASSGHKTSERVGDFNGDGIGDLFDIRNGQAFVSLSSKTAFTSPTVWGSGFSSTGSVHPVDVNSDGKVDLLQFDTAGNATAWLSTGSSLTASSWGTGFGSVPSRITLADVNGDSLVDALRLDPVGGGTNGELWVSVASLTGFASAVNWTTTGSSLDMLRFADFDGDGRTDVLQVQTSGVASVWLSTGTSYPTSTAWAYGTGSVLSELKVADANADGKADLFRIASDGNVYVWPSTGRSFDAPSLWARGARSSDGLLDVNADGAADLVRLDAGSGTTVNVLAAHNTGAKFGNWNVWGQLDLRVTRPASGGCSSNGANVWCTSNGFLGLADPNAFTCATVPDPNCVGGHPIGNPYNTCTGFMNVLTSATCISGGATSMQLGDFTGDGRLDFAVLRTGDGSVTVSKTNGLNTDVLTAIVTGMGHRTDIEYAPITDSATYTPEAASYPERSLVGSMFVVRTVRESDGLTGQKATTFAYAGGKTDLRGRGFLGFRQVTQSSPNTDGTLVTNVTQFAQAFPYIGLPVSEERAVKMGTSSPIVVRRTTNTFNRLLFTGTVTRMFPYTERTVVTGADLGGVALPTTTTTNTYDSSGNVTRTVVQSSAGKTTTTDNTYAPANTTSWILGRLTRATVTSAVGTDTRVRTSAFEYDPTSGMLTKEIVEPDNAALRLETAYGYDSFGNKTTTTISASDVPARTSTKVYDALGRFVVSESNALGHLTTFAFAEPRLPVPTRVVQPNNLATTKTYNSLGTTLTITRPDGVVTTITDEKLNGSIKYDHPAKTCSNGVNSCTTPSRARTDTPLAGGPAGTQANGCSLGYWSGANFCAGNPVNGVCPGSLVQGSFDFAEGRIEGVHEDGLLCYPSNVPVYGIGAVVKTTRSTPGAPTTTTYADVLGREIKKETIGFDGRTVIVETVYDRNGRMEKRSLPYFAGEAVYWTTYTYDALGRPLSVTMPDGRVESTAYSGLSDTVTNARGQTLRRTKNTEGNLLSVTDTAGGVITYTYDPIGNLIETRDPAGNVTTFTYDIRGRKLSVTDPDMGLVNFKYNGVGELVEEDNPVLRSQSKKLTTTYDKLGRITAKDEGGSVSSFTYDTCANGVGKLCVATSTGYSRQVTYDVLSRVTSESVTLFGTSFVTTTGYDSLSRIDTLTYPGGFQVKNEYNARGHLAAVRDPVTSAAHWQAVEVDAHGVVTKERFGNNVETVRSFNPASGNLTQLRTGPSSAPSSVQNLTLGYDTLGNVTSRTDSVAGVGESFSYDHFNRLLAVTPTAGSPTPLTLAYDSSGNITSKSDVGAYSYVAQPAGRSAKLPHAVSQAGGNSYTYDANGNMITGAGRAITWTPFNMPASISTLAGKSSTFAYGPERQRIRQTTETGAVTLYVSSGFERVTQGAVVKDKHYVFAGSAVVAQFTKTGSTLDKAFLHRDNLGSVAVITNAAGAVVERMSFDAFGKRRNVNGSPASVITVGSGVNRGFTGHEMLDNLGLVHMNGRIQDPVIGRFLSADPVIQTPEQVQNLNRYSYVGNNPLSVADPSGHVSVGRIFFGLLALGVAIFAPYLLPTILQNALAVGVLKAAIVGALMGYVFGGTVQSALMGAFSGVMFYGVGSATAGNPVLNVVAHGVVGGVLSVMNGGSFTSGFLSNALSALVTPYISSKVALIKDNQALQNCVGAAAAALIGGVTSVLGGGKFENGAISAAYGYLFNAGLHRASAIVTRITKTVDGKETGHFFIELYDEAGRFVVGADYVNDAKVYEYTLEAIEKEQARWRTRWANKGVQSYFREFAIADLKAAREKLASLAMNPGQLDSMADSACGSICALVINAGNPYGPKLPTAHGAFKAVFHKGASKGFLGMAGTVGVGIGAALAGGTPREVGAAILEDFVQNVNEQSSLLAPQFESGIGL